MSKTAAAGALGGSSLPTGSVIAFAGTTAPEGFLLCDGSELDVNDYKDLYNTIGNSYGTTDSGVKFNLPDLRGRFIRGVDSGAGNDPDAGSRIAAATGGNTGDNVGSLQDDMYKSHKHGIRLSHEHGGAHDHYGLPQVDWTGPMYTHDENQPDGSYSYRGGSGNPLYKSGGNETRPRNISCNYIIKY